MTLLPVRIFLFIALFSLNTLCFGQNEFEWVSTYNGVGNHEDFGSAICLDDYGRIYCTGNSTESNDSYDIVTNRLDPSNGSIMWTKTYRGSNSSQNNVSSDITTDDSLYIYVVGTASNSNSNDDFITLKYDSIGNLKWAKAFNNDSVSSDAAQSIAVDKRGDVYVAGTSKLLDSVMVVIKYNSNGDTLWTYRFSGAALGIWNETIRIEWINEDLFVGASSGRGVHIARLNSTSGIEYWSKFHFKSMGIGNTIDRILDMKIDANKNICFTGDYVDTDSLGNPRDFGYIAKYDSLGDEKWFKFYEQTCGQSIDFDELGNVYVAANNHGPDSTGWNYMTVKISSSGKEEWVKIHNGNYVSSSGFSGDDRARYLKVCSDGVYVVGGAKNIVEGVETVGIVTLKYSLQGEIIWKSIFPSQSFGNQITVDDNCNAYVTGSKSQFGGVTSEKDFVCIKYGLKTSVIDLSERNNSIYPNPFTHNIRVVSDFKGQGDLKVYDITGRPAILINNVEVKNFSLNLSSISSGSYLMHFVSRNKIIFSTKIYKL